MKRRRNRSPHLRNCHRPKSQKQRPRPRLLRRRRCLRQLRSPLGQVLPPNLHKFSLRARHQRRRQLRTRGHYQHRLRNPMATTQRSNRPRLKERHQPPFQSQARSLARRRCTSYPIRRAVAAHSLRSCFAAEKLMTRRLSPHCRADSSADCACTSANDCTGRSCDEKAANAAETRARQKPHSRLFPARQQQRAPTYSSDFPPKRKLSAAISNG